MSRFRRHKREMPGLNLASMPDLVFTVLFFFMIVTHMREDNIRVRFTVPQGTELEKTEHRGSVIHVYIGHPTDSQGNSNNNETRIQVNSKSVTIDQLPKAIATERDHMSSEDRQHMVSVFLQIAKPTWDLSAMLSKHCAKLVHSESTMQPQIAPTKQAMSNNLKEKRTKIL